MLTTWNWKKKVASRPAGMGRIEYLRFALLYREFEGSGIVGLGLAVRVVRKISKPFRFQRVQR